jgi:transcription antitermination factor NusG
VVVVGVASEKSSMAKSDLKFEVGDRIKFVLRSGKIEEGVVKAVFETTTGVQLNVSFGKGLSASVDARQVIGKLPPVN